MLKDQNYTRWYDCDVHIQLLMETLELANDDMRIFISTDIIQLILNDKCPNTDSLIEKINPDFRRRWYDENETVHSAVELLKYTKPKEKEELLMEVLSSVVYYKNQWGN